MTARTLHPRHNRRNRNIPGVLDLAALWLLSGSGPTCRCGGYAQLRRCNSNKRTASGDIALGSLPPWETGRHSSRQGTLL